MSKLTSSGSTTGSSPRGTPTGPQAARSRAASAAANATASPGAVASETIRATLVRQPPPDMLIVVRIGKGQRRHLDELGAAQPQHVLLFLALGFRDDDHAFQPKRVGDHRREEALGEFTVRMVGAHNALNALAVIAVAEEMEIPLDIVREALVGYSSGGMLTYRYVCARPGKLAVAVVVSGSLESTCDAGITVPDVLTLHGKRDGTIGLTRPIFITRLGLAPRPQHRKEAPQRREPPVRFRLSLVCLCRHGC